ncbi:MAG TPA: aldehyde dehydrogenase family protein [Candidatus Paceibacterota bacterium]|nr:aldehyde dehydrogenase family protein [Candidatus Paceibacterota bacterium]
MSIRSVNPRTGEEFGPTFEATSSREIDSIIDGAVASFSVWSQTAPKERARVLNHLAESIDSNLDALVAIADLETGLGVGRLTGEVARTTFQIRTFANALAANEFVGPTLDAAVEAPLPQGHPKFLRTMRAIGPVAIFGASNFPFAFSVLGGDTASALAAGCSVVIKAHPSHPQTSQLTFDIAAKSLIAAGAPVNLIGLGHGFEFGKAVIADPRINAGAFTGSRAGGRALFDMAQARNMPIPFYGELGSVNPVVATAAGISDRSIFVGGYLDSLLLGNGQFCTNPSLLFVPEDEHFLAELQSQLSHREAQPFLSEATKNLHDANREKLAESLGSTDYFGKNAQSSGFYSRAEVFVLPASQARVNSKKLHIECFGPTGIIVTYSSIGEVKEILSKLEGALVGCLFSSSDDASNVEIASVLASMCGRVAFNAWPTGVAVTSGQHHGGPYPASTSPLHTSVGINAISRFLRPVTFQGLPDELASNLGL